MHYEARMLTALYYMAGYTVDETMKQLVRHGHDVTRHEIVGLRRVVPSVLEREQQIHDLMKLCEVPDEVHEEVFQHCSPAAAQAMQRAAARRGFMLSGTELRETAAEMLEVTDQMLDATVADGDRDRLTEKYQVLICRFAAQMLSQLALEPKVPFDAVAETMKTLRHVAVDLNEIRTKQKHTNHVLKPGNGAKRLTIIMDGVTANDSRAALITKAALASAGPMQSNELITIEESHE